MLDPRKDAQGRDLPLELCPTCGFILNAATHTEGEAARPSPGDLSVCGQCGEALIFDKDLRPRLPSVADLMSLDKDTHRRITKAQRVIRKNRPFRSE